MEQGQGALIIDFIYQWQCYFWLNSILIAVICFVSRVILAIAKLKLLNWSFKLKIRTVPVAQIMEDIFIIAFMDKK